VREGVPAPLRLGGEGKLLVAIGEALQSRHVGGEDEAAVPDAERGAGIDGADDGRVAGHAGAAIDRIMRPSRRGAPGEGSGGREAQRGGGQTFGDGLEKEATIHRAARFGRGGAGGGEY